MSGYSASCPSCGAQVHFKLGSSMIRVCEHCGVAVVRTVGAVVLVVGVAVVALTVIVVMAVEVAGVEVVRAVHGKGFVRFEAIGQPVVATESSA